MPSIEDVATRITILETKQKNADKQDNLTRQTIETLVDAVKELSTIMKENPPHTLRREISKLEKEHTQRINMIELEFKLFEKEIKTKVAVYSGMIGAFIFVFNLISKFVNL